MTTGPPAPTLVDVEHLGNARMIASCLLRSTEGHTVVDPGPASTVSTLCSKLHQAGVSIGEVQNLLLTHIHLDHAGGTGVLVRANPRLRVFVHESGVRHLADPTRLIQSATRIYGTKMDEFWGDILPVPESNLCPLQGGERLSVSGRAIDVTYTPGHASHHVCYFDTRSRVAFVGDICGIRTSPHAYVLPPTPPPDIDLESWRQSLARIRQQKPGQLFLTHFGFVNDVEAHLGQLEERLLRWSCTVQESLKQPGRDSERAAAFVRSVVAEMKRHLPQGDVARYEKSTGLQQSWYGLARYWRQRGM